MPRLPPLLLAALVAAPAAAALGLAAPPAPHGPAAVVEDVWVPGHEGVLLRATWFQPAGTGPFPLVLRTHGWAQVRDTEPTGLVGRLIDRGYAVLTWDSRGFGESHGVVTLDSPEHEVRDVSALLDWAAAQRPVALDGPGDPRVGMTGVSYAGGIQLLAGAFEPRLDALVPEITWHDLRHSLGPHGVLKLGWVLELYLAGQLSAHLGTYDPRHPEWLHPNAEGLHPEVTRWLAESLAANRISDAAAEGLGHRSLAAHLDRNPDFPPAFLVQGWKDTLFTPNEGAWNHAALRARGHHATLLVHGGGHGYATPQGDAVAGRVLDFLDYWVKQTAAPVPPDVEVFLPFDERWQVLGAWPLGGERLALGAGAPVAAGPTGTLGGGAPGLVVVPATVAPAAFTEVPNFQEDLNLPAFDAPGTAAVFATPPLAGPRDVVGTPRVRLVLAGPVPDAALFLKVLDLAPAGSGQVVVGRQVTPVRVESAQDEVVVDLELAAIAHRFEEGHRIALAVSASDAGHLASRLPVPAVLRADGSSWVELP